MDHRLRMETRRNYATEGSLDFGSQQQASCLSSARSFSTPSSDPYTPTSGRSTPQQAPGSVANFDPVICSSSCVLYELTPPASDLESYFPLEIKSEYPPAVPNCAAIMRTPVDKYEPGMNIAIHQMPDSVFHGLYSEPPSSQPLQQYSFPVQHMRHSPSNVSTGSYMLPGSALDALHEYQSVLESLHDPFYPRPAASMVPVEPLDVPMPSRSPRSGGALASNGRKRRIKQVQQKTKNLRRAQREPSERSEAEACADEDWTSDIKCLYGVEPPAAHFCQVYGCNKSFRRLEHLKRHHDTVHYRYKVWKCEFCPPQKGPKVFNRFDNYRSHVILHTKRPSSSTKRTNYHPAAAAHMAALEAEMKVRTRKRTERAPASSSSSSTAAAGAAGERKSSPTPSSSTAGAYTPSNSSAGSDEATPLMAARQGFRRLDLKASASPAI